jgi:hypothetical protein
LDAAGKNNVNLNRRNMGRWFVDDAELKDLHLHGRRYTWSNGCARLTLEKLDRVLISVDWESLFPDCFLQALSSDTSNQSHTAPPRHQHSFPSKEKVPVRELLDQDTRLYSGG